jgi:hypothetical protein
MLPPIILVLKFTRPSLQEGDQRSDSVSKFVQALCSHAVERCATCVTLSHALLYGNIPLTNLLSSLDEHPTLCANNKSLEKNDRAGDGQTDGAEQCKANVRDAHHDISLRRQAPARIHTPKSRKPHSCLPASFRFGAHAGQSGFFAILVVRSGMSPVRKHSL